MDYLFCNETCRTEAFNSFHKFECNAGPLLRDLGVGHLALKTALIAATNPHSSAYEQVNSLVSHLNHIPSIDLAQYALVSWCSSQRWRANFALWSPVLVFHWELIVRNWGQLLNCSQYSPFCSLVFKSRLGAMVKTSLNAVFRRTIRNSLPSEIWDLKSDNFINLTSGHRMTGVKYNVVDHDRQIATATLIANGLLKQTWMRRSGSMA